MAPWPPWFRHLCWCSLSDTHHNFELQPVFFKLIYFMEKITIYFMGKINDVLVAIIVVCRTTDDSFNIMIHFFQASLSSLRPCAQMLGQYHAGADLEKKMGWAGREKKN